MSDSVKPVQKPSSVVDVRLEVLNINGRKSGHFQERRARISAYLKSCKDKPDFLVLVDNVAKLHVTTFCAALHERWMGADYKDIAYVWKGNKYVNEGGYRQNHEALLYDSNVWEYLVGNELLIRNQDFYPKLREFLRNRYRAGVFRHKETHKVVYVVTYHGRNDHPDETKQNGLSELVRALLNKLETAKLSSEPSLFICGDFNFNVGRESYSRDFLEKHQIHLFPQLGCREAVGGSVKAPVDYILTRGPAISISQCYEYNILADTAQVRVSSHPPKELAVSLPIEKLGSDIECLLEKVTEWKRAPRSRILDNECHRGLVRFDVTNLLAEVLEETKRRETTPLKDVFDHNFIHMHAKFGDRLEERKLEDSISDSISDFCYISPRVKAESASVLLTISVKSNGVKGLKEIFSGDGEIWSYPSLWLRIRLESISLKSQRRIYKYVRAQRKGEDELKLRLKDV